MAHSASLETEMWDKQLLGEFPLLPLCFFADQMYPRCPPCKSSKRRKRKKRRRCLQGTLPVTPLLLDLSTSHAGPRDLAVQTPTRETTAVPSCPSSSPSEPSSHCCSASANFECALCVVWAVLFPLSLRGDGEREIGAVGWACDLGRDTFLCYP